MLNYPLPPLPLRFGVACCALLFGCLWLLLDLNAHTLPYCHSAESSKRLVSQSACLFLPTRSPINPRKCRRLGSEGSLGPYTEDITSAFSIVTRLAAKRFAQTWPPRPGNSVFFVFFDMLLPQTTDWALHSLKQCPSRRLCAHFALQYVFVLPKTARETAKFSFLVFIGRFWPPAFPSA